MKWSHEAVSKIHTGIFGIPVCIRKIYCMSLNKTIGIFKTIDIMKKQVTPFQVDGVMDGELLDISTIVDKAYNQVVDIRATDYKI